MLDLPDHGFVLGWLRTLGQKLSAGRREAIDVMPDGRARLTVVYPSLGAMLAALAEVDGIVAMAREDAAAADQDVLFGIVRDYHQGDGDGE